MHKIHRLFQSKDPCIHPPRLMLVSKSYLVSPPNHYSILAPRQPLLWLLLWFHLIIKFIQMKSYLLFFHFFCIFFTGSFILQNEPAIHLLSFSKVTAEEYFIVCVFIYPIYSLRTLEWFPNYMLLFICKSSAHMYAFLLRISPREEILSHKMSICSTLVYNNKLFATPHQQCIWVLTPHLWLHLVLSIWGFLDF